jgi:hypothetical protein
VKTSNLTKTERLSGWWVIRYNNIQVSASVTPMTASRIQPRPFNKQTRAQEIEYGNFGSEFHLGTGVRAVSLMALSKMCIERADNVAVADISTFDSFANSNWTATETSLLQPKFPSLRVSTATGQNLLGSVDEGQENS